MLKDFVKCGKLIYIRKPEFKELKYIANLWSDEETMKDVGGCVHFPEEKRQEWYRKMVDPADGKNFYCLIFNREHDPVGEVSFHRFKEREGRADLNIKVQAKFRGRGYAKEAMRLLLDYYFNDFGGRVIFDEVINTGGQCALTNFGFEIIDETEGKVLFKLTRERFSELYEGYRGRRGCLIILMNK